MDATNQVEQPLRSVKRGRPAKAVELPVVQDVESAQQSLATRIWDGQSPDLPVSDRVQRIVNALKAQGLGIDVTLPDTTADRYLKAAL